MKSLSSAHIQCREEQARDLFFFLRVLFLFSIFLFFCKGFFQVFFCFFFGVFLCIIIEAWGVLFWGVLVLNR